jgi:transcriptional regulator with XRE-family HTH domain
LSEASSKSYIEEMARTKWADERFGQQLKRMRDDERGWTQSQMADMLSEKGIAPMHSTTLAKIEAGTRSVRINEAVAIADLLGVSVDALLGRQRHDDTTLTFALVTLMGYVTDCQRQIREAQGTAADIAEQVDDLPEQFNDVPALPDLQRAARGLSAELKRAATAAEKFVFLASVAIADLGKEATK